MLYIRIIKYSFKTEVIVLPNDRSCFLRHNSNIVVGEVGRSVIKGRKEIKRDYSASVSILRSPGTSFSRLNALVM